MLIDLSVIPSMSILKTIYRNYVRKKDLMNINCKPQPVFEAKSSYEIISFVDTPSVASTYPTVCGVSKKKGIKPMYDEFDDECCASPSDRKVDYLRGRLYNAEEVQVRDLKHKFGLTDDPTPNNGKEFLERIQAGKFILDEKKATNPWGCILHAFTWRDPAKKENKDGYAAAYIEMSAKYNDTKDIIAIKTADEGLEALKAFEAWKPTGTAS